ncbi:MAG TPA: carboxypeptidase-like regulatory domain-containing protein, partial [Candidatus Binataceae bacterium]|nr:carboxypeptidase-like regulatory domain-containing protein [Candidatus Binataceae bacterium]
MGKISALLLSSALAIAIAPAARASEIVGRVVDFGGRPIAGEQVLLRVFSSTKREQALTDAAGRYAIEGLKPGVYVLYLRGQSAVAYVDAEGLTVDWGLSLSAPPVAVATR